MCFLSTRQRPLLGLSLMIGFALALCSSASCTSASWAQDPEAMRIWGERYEAEVLPLIKSHCLECHNADDPSGEFNLSGLLDGPSAIANPLIWDQVGKRIRLNEMPPEGSPQFSDPEKGRVYSWLDSRPASDDCDKLATDETQAWYVGYVMSRRLTKTEYLNAMRDLLGVEVDSRFEIPADGSGGLGFDTNGSTLFTSPLHIEQYLAAASDAVQRAIGDPSTRATVIGSVDPAVDRTAQAIDRVYAFARLAWRRPLNEKEQERLKQLYLFGVEAADSSAKDSAATQWTEAELGGFRHAMTGLLISPNFLFVVEAESEAGGVQRLTEYELATRLSLFIWSSIPDQALLEAAESGNLETKEQILAQTNRMLLDPRSRALGENFGLQWLGLTHYLENAKPDEATFPDYDRNLNADLREEVVRSIAVLFQERRSILELIDSPTIQVNGRLAAYYGLELAPDAPWQSVDAGDLPRGGVITMGAVLMHTSYPSRTSPVLRGRWLLEEVLGDHVPPPPPGVPPLEAAVSQQVVSLRERLELHRQNPECASCHSRIDPLGFGLENFDALGRWREDDHGAAIDSRGTLPNGQTFAGPEELKQVLLQRSEEFQRHISRKMLGFALGRELTKFDDCVVDDCMEALAARDRDASAIVETIVTSFPFRHRYFKAAEAVP